MSGELASVVFTHPNSPTRGLHMIKGKLWLTSCSRSDRCRFSRTLLSRAKALERQFQQVAAAEEMAL